MGPSLDLRTTARRGHQGCHRKPEGFGPPAQQLGNDEIYTSPSGFTSDGQLASTAPPRRHWKPQDILRSQPPHGRPEAGSRPSGRPRTPQAPDGHQGGPWPHAEPNASGLPPGWDACAPSAPVARCLPCAAGPRDVPAFPKMRRLREAAEMVFLDGDTAQQLIAHYNYAAIFSGRYA
jgi:hypothetical protein